MKDQRTDQELNRLIAGWMGWTFYPEIYPEEINRHMLEFWADSEMKTKNAYFCTDLNAIHGAVNKLPEGPYVWWSNHLMQICGTHLKCINAGPRERAEALVALIESKIPLHS